MSQKEKNEGPNLLMRTKQIGFIIPFSWSRGGRGANHERRKEKGFLGGAR